MRVFATASGNQHSNAIGRVELCCTPAGLAIGLFGVGAYSEGYAVGALTHGTRFTIAYQAISGARAYEDQLQLDISVPSFPHDRLSLTRFTSGPGVPPEELRRRRLILHLGALAFAALASLSSVFIAPALSANAAAWSTLSYGLIAGFLVLGLGYAIDHTFFLKRAGDTQTRLAFVRELAAYVPALVVSEGQYVPALRRFSFDMTAFVPKSATMAGVVIAALVLTGLVTGQRLLMSDNAQQLSAREPLTTLPLTTLPTPTAPAPSEAPDPLSPLPTAPAPAPTEPTLEANSNSPSPVIERRCLCDRADSALWTHPIPRLSALLIERRTVPTKTHIRTALDIAIVNNSDTEIDEITVHIQFYEKQGKKQVPTKDRPLYFEGPLLPGRAIKWTTEARGDSYEIFVPDLGNLGPNGDGAASAESFVTLLEANHRPVRLHAARILSYLGDSRARDAALRLKDAMRAAESPFLRRVLMATGEVRVCDTEVAEASSTSLGVCVYNASDEERSDLGLQINALSRSLDVQQPLADPPELLGHAKWQVPGVLTAQSGAYIRVPIPPHFTQEHGHNLEVLADRYDLLD